MEPSRTPLSVSSSSSKAMIFTCPVLPASLTALSMAGPALRRVAVLRDDENASGRVVNHLRLVRGVNGADGHAVDALREQVVNDALLVGGCSVRRNAELDLDVTEFLHGLLRPAPRNRPEVRRVVCDEGEPELLRRRGRRPLLLLARAAEQDGSRGETNCERERRPVSHFRSA